MTPKTCCERGSWCGNVRIKAKKNWLVHYSRVLNTRGVLIVGGWELFQKLINGDRNNWVGGMSRWEVCQALTNKTPCSTAKALDLVIYNQKEHSKLECNDMVSFQKYKTKNACLEI